MAPEGSDKREEVNAAMQSDETLDGARVSAVYRRTMSSGRARLAEVLGGQVEVESSGAWITASDGRRYLNAGGYGVFHHRRPASHGGPRGRAAAAQPSDPVPVSSWSRPPPAAWSC